MKRVSRMNSPTCLLKIHEHYCDKILEGVKFYEYRKKCPERESALALLPVDIYDERLKSIKDGADVGELTKSLYEQAVRVGIDKRGRIRIPPKLLACIRLGKSGKVVLRGHISTIDIFKGDAAACSGGNDLMQ